MIKKMLAMVTIFMLLISMIGCAEGDTDVKIVAEEQVEIQDQIENIKIDKLYKIKKEYITDDYQFYADEKLIKGKQALICVEIPKETTKLQLYYLAEYLSTNKYSDFIEFNIDFYTSYDENKVLRTYSRSGMYLLDITSDKWITFDEVIKTIKD